MSHVLSVWWFQGTPEGIGSRINVHKERHYVSGSIATFVVANAPGAGTTCPRSPIHGDRRAPEVLPKARPLGHAAPSLHMFPLAIRDTTHCRAKTCSCRSYCQRSS